MSDEEQLITCIYCKEVRPPSREHVLARSLGGDATALIICKKCNTTILSPLDQALAERSFVAWSRAGETPADAFDVRIGGEHFHHDVTRDVYTEINLVNGLRPVPFPQIHFRLGKGEATIIAADPPAIQSLVTFIDKRITSGSLRSMHVKVGPMEYCSTARLVLHRSKDGFLRVRDVGDEQRVYDALEKQWPTLRAQMLSNQFAAESEAKPTVDVNIPIKLDDIFRAVAKTAFNTLAMRVGVALALSHEFDELRAYVLGRDIRHPERLEPGEIAVDDRFVRMISFGEPPLVPTEEHAVTLFYYAGQMLAYVTLYKVHSFVVILGTIALPEAVLITHEFSSVRSGNRALDVETVYERLVRRGDKL